jgi:hypothetical protein
LLWPEVFFNVEPSSVQSWVNVVAKLVRVVFVSDAIL